MKDVENKGIAESLGIRQDIETTRGSMDRALGLILHERDEFNRRVSRILSESNIPTDAIKTETVIDINVDAVFWKQNQHVMAKHDNFVVFGYNISDEVSKRGVAAIDDICALSDQAREAGIDDIRGFNRYLTEGYGQLVGVCPVYGKVDNKTDRPKPIKSSVKSNGIERNEVVAKYDSSIVPPCPC